MNKKLIYLSVFLVLALFLIDACSNLKQKPVGLRRGGSCSVSCDDGTSCSKQCEGGWAPACRCGILKEGKTGNAVCGCYTSIE